MAMISDILTAREAANYLPIDLRTLNQCMAARQIPYRKVEDHDRFRRSELDTWLNQQAGCSVDEAIGARVPQQAPTTRRLIVKIEPVPSGRPAYRKNGDRWVPTAAFKDRSE